jgi:hypothetical protein
MSDYRGHHIGTWREGSLRNFDTVLVIVSHDQKHDAYLIPKGEYDEFLFWAEGIWDDADMRVVKLEDAQ